MNTLHVLLKPRPLATICIILIFVCSVTYGFIVTLAEQNNYNRLFEEQANNLLELDYAYAKMEKTVLRHANQPASNESLKALRQAFVPVEQRLRRLMTAIREESFPVDSDVLYDLVKVEKSIETVSQGLFQMMNSHSSEETATIAKLQKQYADEFEYLSYIVPSMTRAVVLDSQLLAKVHQTRQEKLSVLIAFFLIVSSGSLLIFMLLSRDLSYARIKRSRHEISQRHTNLINAIDQATDGIALAGEDGKFSYVNKAFAMHYGYDVAGEVIGMDWQEFFRRIDEKWFMGHVIKEFEKTNKWQGTLEGQAFQLAPFQHKISFSYLHGGGIVCIVKDITNLTEAEALAQTRLSAIEMAKDGIGIVDKDGMLTYINRALLDLHGITHKKDVIGRPWTALYNEQGQHKIKTEVLPYLRREGQWFGEAPVVREDGSIVPAELSLKALDNGGMIGMARDVTDRIVSEQEKSKLQKQIFQAQKMEAIGQLSGGIAHDFNNILSALIGYAEFLEEDLEDGTSEHKFAKNILAAGEQARALVDQILAFSRQGERAMEVTSIYKTARSAVTMLEATLPRSITMDVDLDYEGNQTIFGDPTMINQAIINLALNAKDAIADEVGTIAISLKPLDTNDVVVQSMMSDKSQDQDSAGTPPIQIIPIDNKRARLLLGTLSEQQDYVVLDVSDNGSGLSYDLMEHIFEPFFTTKDVNEGTGLGLASVHGIMASHHGGLILESTLGEGTTFRLIFPLAQEQMRDNAQRSISGNNDKSDDSKESGVITVVDDQPEVSAVIAAILERMGYDVLICDSAQEAIEALAEDAHFCDLILSDHTMPEMTGLELASFVSDTYPHMPVVLISGYSKKKLEEERKNIPAIKALLRKPVDRKLLSQTMRRVLAESVAAQGKGDKKAAS